MKKNYVKPKCKVYDLKGKIQILAGSGDKYYPTAPPQDPGNAI